MDIKELKARVYDLMVEAQRIQQALQQGNQEIAQEEARLRNAPPPKLETK